MRNKGEELFKVDGVTGHREITSPDWSAEKSVLSWCCPQGPPTSWAWQLVSESKRGSSADGNQPCSASWRLCEFRQFPDPKSPICKAGLRPQSQEATKTLKEM